MKVLARASKMVENRASPRRKLFLREGSLVDRRPERLLRCVIKDGSEGGARVRVVFGEVVGDEVTLIDTKEGTERPARIVWRSGSELGLSYTGEVRRGRPRSVEGV